MASIDTNNCKLLIVEDCLEDQAFFRECLRERTDFHLSFASLGEEAVRMIAADTYDCVLLDYQLPDRDGVSLCSEFSVMPNIKRNLTPIIIVTGQSTERVVIDFLRAGAADYLTKGSLSVDMLSRTIDSAVRCASSQRKIDKQQQALECKEKAFRALLEMELKSIAHLRSVFEGSPAGIISLDSRGVIMRANEAASIFLGQRGRVLSGQAVVRISPHFTEALLARCYASLVPGSPASEILVVTSDDKEVGCTTWRVSCCAIRLHEESHETALGLSLFFQDVTAFIQSQKKLNEALQAKSDLICSASHELKTPITGISLGMQSFRRKLVKDDPRAVDPTRLLKIADATLGQLGKLTRLVDDMFDYSSITTGKLRILKSYTNVCLLVAEVVERFSQPGKVQNVFLINEMKENVYAEIDPLRIEQVISNFISNAIRYAPLSKVVIGLREEGADFLRISVRDDGPGIPAEKQAQIFTKFERGDHQHKAQGLGLGLYIAKQIVEQHQGQIGVESGSGTGCLFYFTVWKASLRT